MRRSSLLFLAGWGGLVCPPLFAASLCFEVELAGPPRPDTKAALRLTFQGTGSPTGSDSFEQELSLPGKVTVELPRAGSWEVRLESTALWAEPRWVHLEKGSSPPCEPLKAYPQARLEGLLEGPPATHPSGPIEARFVGSPGVPAADRVPRGKLPCKAAGGRLSCAVPAGQVDVRLAAPGFVPFYFWDLPLGREQPRDLGSLRWQKGSSVVGWVAPPAGSKRLGQAQLEITPEVAGDLSRAETWDRARRLTQTVEATERGFFQFRALDPGLYRLSVKHPAWVAPPVFPVEVRRDLEAEISQPILLSPSVAWTVHVDPPLSPGGIPWAVHLEGRTEANFAGSEPEKPGASAEGGLWRWQGLPPGAYQLSIQDEEGTLWWREPVELSAGLPPLRVEIPLVPIRGRIWLGKEPLAAQLVFGGRLGKRRIPLHSDEEGTFSGLLTDEGEWRVDLVAESPSLRMSLPPVEVKRRPGKSYAEVEIRLPDTWLRGEVVDEKGRPLPEAVVQVQIGFGAADFVRVDARGKFEARGLAPGPASLEAQAGERTSDWVPVVIEESAEEGNSIRLVARLKTTLAGRVSANGAPVAGARLRVWPDYNGVPVMNVARAVTGPEGEFTVSLPEGLTAVNVMTLAPGFPLQWRRLVLADPPRVEIQLAPVGGTLVLNAGPNRKEPAGLLVHGGTFVPVNTLSEWMRLQSAPAGDGTWIVPNVEPGDYVLCHDPRLERRSWCSGKARLKTLATRDTSPRSERLALSPPVLAPPPAEPEARPK